MEKQTVKIITDSEAEKKSLVVQNITLQSIDRTPKDIANWKTAIETAESVYYPNRAELYDLYSRIELDGHLSGIWRKHLASIRNKKLCYYDNAGKKVEEMETLFKTNAWRKLIKLIMESESHGISGVEFIPGSVFTFIPIPRKHIQPHKRVIIKNQYDHDGIAYEKIWNIIVIGDKDNLGFMAKVAPYVLWKQGNYGDWAQFCEIYGHPTELYKYDVYDIKTKQASADVMKNAGGSRKFLIPKQLEFEMMDGKQASSDGGLYDKLKNACNDEISVCVLGNTETTKSSTSSGYAQAAEHAAQQDEIMEDDLCLVKNTLNDLRMYNILKSYTYPVSEGGYFEYETVPDLIALGKKKDIDIAMSKLIPIGDDYLYETYHIPKPDNYDELKNKMEEERQTAISNKQQAGSSASPAGGGGEAGGGKPKTGSKKSKGEIKNLSLLESFRSTLADFFAPAHKD